MPHQLSLLGDRIGISVKVRPAGPIRSDFFRPVPVVENSDPFHLLSKHQLEIHDQKTIQTIQKMEEECVIGVKKSKNL